MKSLKKYLENETVMYLIFGFLTTIVNYAVFTPLHYILDMHELVANVLAWIAAATFSYITSRIFVFKSNIRYLPGLIREILFFYGSRLFSLGVETLGLYILCTCMGLNAIVIKLFLSFAVIVINYVLSKLVIFKKKEN